MERVRTPRTLLIARLEAYTLDLFMLYTCHILGPDVLCEHGVTTKDDRKDLRGTLTEGLMT